MQQEALDAEFQLRAAEADLASVRVRLQNELLQQQSAAADIQAQFHRARITAEANEQLSKEGLQSAVTTQISRVEADELENRHRIEQERLKIRGDSAQAQLAAEQARVAQRRALYELRRSQIEALKVRAGIAGVLQVVPVEVGQRVAVGANLARVAAPGPPEGGAADSRNAGQGPRGRPARRRSTRGTARSKGRVARVDPAAQNGTVLVDVSFTGPLPRGARPDLSVDGTIELERLDNVLYVGRPAFGQENSTVSLFKLLGPPEKPDAAERVQVKFGRSSVNTIEVVGGLREGDRVILSDMSAWDGRDRLRIR